MNGSEFNVADCEWKEDSDGCWWTSCDNGFEFIDGSPEENKMKFCCYCGKPLKQVVFKEEEDEQDRPLRRHPGDFDDYPTDEQKEYFKRGGR